MNKKLKRMAVVGATVLMTASSLGDAAPDRVF